MTIIDQISRPMKAHFRTSSITTGILLILSSLNYCFLVSAFYHQNGLDPSTGSSRGPDPFKSSITMSLLEEAQAAAAIEASEYLDPVPEDLGGGRRRRRRRGGAAVRRGEEGRGGGGGEEQEEGGGGAAAAAAAPRFRLEGHDAAAARRRQQRRRLEKSKNSLVAQKLPFHGSRQASQRLQGRLAKATSATQLANLLELWRYEANAVSVAAAWARAARLPPPREDAGAEEEEVEAAAAAAAARAEDPAAEAAALGRLMAITFAVLPGLGPRQLCNILWAMGKLRIKNKPLIAELTARLLRPGGADRCRPQELAMAVWAFATLRVHSRKLFYAVGARVAQEAAPMERASFSLDGSGGGDDDKAKDCGERPAAAAAAPAPAGAAARWGVGDLALVAWAFGRNGHVDQEAVEAMARALGPGTAGGGGGGGGGWAGATPRDTAMLCWGAVETEALQWRLQGATREILAGAAGALLELAGPNEGGGEGVAAEEPTPPPRSLLGRRFRPHDLAQTAVAFARFGYLDEALMGMLSSVARNQLNKFSNQEQCNMAWSFARLYSNHSEPLFRDIAVSLKPKLKELKTQELANLAWSFVVMEVYDEGFLTSVFFEAGRRDPNTLADEELRQFHQALEGLRAARPWAARRVGGRGGRFAGRCRAAWAREKARPKRSSGRHQAVSQTFEAMGLTHANEDENDIDIALTHKQFGKVAVEVDGPSHYTTNRPAACLNQTESAGRGGASAAGASAPAQPSSSPAAATAAKPPPPLLLGHTRLKHRLLGLKGWKVVQIPYYEWDRIPFWSSMEKKRYVQRKLQIEAVVYSQNDWSSYRAYPSGAGQLNRFD